MSKASDDLDLDKLEQRCRENIKEWRRNFDREDWARTCSADKFSCGEVLSLLSRCRTAESNFALRRAQVLDLTARAEAAERERDEAQKERENCKRDYAKLLLDKARLEIERDEARAALARWNEAVAELQARSWGPQWVAVVRGVLDELTRLATERREGE